MIKTREDALRVRSTGGMRKGTKIKKTLLKEEIIKDLKQRIFGSMTHLFNAARTSAVGHQVLFRIDTKIDDNGKKYRSEPIVVKDLAEISAYVDRLQRFEDGTIGTVQDESDDTKYYFMTIREPDIRAFNALVDRGLGKVKETIEHEIKLPQPLIKITDTTARTIHGNNQSLLRDNSTPQTPKAE